MHTNRASSVHITGSEKVVFVQFLAGKTPIGEEIDDYRFLRSRRVQGRRRCRFPIGLSFPRSENAYQADVALARTARCDDPENFPDYQMVPADLRTMPANDAPVKRQMMRQEPSREDADGHQGKIQGC